MTCTDWKAKSKGGERRLVISGGSPSDSLLSGWLGVVVVGY